MNVALVGQRIERVRDLAGFRISHRVPDVVNDLTNAFVGSIAAGQIDADLGSVYAALREQFRLKRRELTVSPPADGRGSITTPYFDFSIAVALEAGDPSRVTWHRQVSEIKNPAQVLSEPFATVFGGMFDTVELIPPRSIDLTALIDRIEDIESQQFTLAYDKDATWCRLSIVGIAGEMEITSRSLALIQRPAKSPGVLLQSFLDFHAALLETYDIGMIGANGSSKPGMF